MSQDPTTTSPSEPAVPAPRKRKRLWLKILLGVVVLIVILVALLPTIASTGMARSMILGKVNEQINGQVEIGSWSLGWFSPISVSGIKVYDNEKRLILDIPNVKLGLSLLGAIRSNFAMGDDNVIDVESFIVRVDETGKTNLEKLPKAPGAKPKEPQSAVTTALPNLSGKFKINFRGTIEGEKVKAPVYVDQSSALVTITDINQPIQNQVSLKYHIGDGGVSSTIETSGSIHAIKNNVLELTSLAAGQKIDLNNVNLVAIEPFLKALGADTRLAGMLTGGIEIKAEGIGGLSANGQIVVNELVFAGGPLGADQFKTQKIAIPVNITRTAMPGGDSLIKFENVGVQMSQGTIAIAGQVTEKSLVNLTEQKPPGADGSISISANISGIADIASQLSNTLHLQKGVQIQNGEVNQQLTVTLSKDKGNVTIAQNLKASASGQRDGRPITLQPITISASAAIIPSGKSVPDVRDLKLAVQSAFATVNGGGDSLAKTEINGSFDLGKLSSEVGQFSDMGDTQLQGGGTFNITTNGDIANLAAPIALATKANLQNVKVISAKQHIDQDRLALVASGNLLRDKNLIDAGWMSIVGGDPVSPLLDVDANANINLAQGSLSWFEVKKCTITSLQRLQQQYAGLLPTLSEKKITIDSGVLMASASGSFQDKTLAFSKPATVSITNVTISKEGRPVLPRENLNASAFGNISLKDGIAATFSDLSLNTDSKMLMISKSGNGDLKVTMTKSAVQGSGALTIAANLKPLADLAQAFSGPVAVPDQPQLKSGQLDGTLSFAHADRPETSIKFDGKVTALTVSSGQTNPIDNEQLTIALNATAPDDPKSPITASGKIGSSFINTNLSDVKVAMGGAMLDMIQSANVDAQADVSKVYMLAGAFTASGPSTQPAGNAEPLAPLAVTSGKANLRVKVARDSASKKTSLEITDATISTLALKRGSRQFAFDPKAPITLKLTASVAGTDKIDQIEVSELNADARIATLSAPDKIVLTGLQGAKMSAKGSIKAQGSIEQLTPLLAVLQGADQMPYAGRYDLAQKISNNGAVMTVDGSIDVSDFKVLAANGRDSVFSEPKIAIRNNANIDPDGQKVAVKTLTVDMPTSQALAVSFTGGVNAWNDKREIRPDTKLDLTYDLEKIWPIVKPMLSPETQTSLQSLKIAGKSKQTFVLSGAFPARPTFGESIKSLNADGGFAIDLLDYSGLTIKKFTPQVKMKNGVLTTSGQPAVANDGRLDISGITLDLTKPDPILTIQKNKKMMEKVKLNPVLADGLGKTAAIIFSNATEASGLLNVTVVDCDKVPMGALIQKRNDAKAEIKFSVSELHLNGPVPQVVGAALSLGQDGFRGSIPESSAKLANGQASTDMTILIAGAPDNRGRARQLPLRFAGGMGLQKLDLRNFVVSVPKGLLPLNRLGGTVGQIAQALPDPLNVPLSGTADKPKFDLDKAITANAGNILQGGNIGDLLNGLGGGNQQQNPPRQPRNQGR